MSIYVVKPKDRVSSIAERFSLSEEQIIFDNQLISPYTLAIGQALYLAEPKSSSLSPMFRSSGYAYPFISRWVLQNTLPFLTVLNIFSYGFTLDGHLIPPAWDDLPLIEAARSGGTLPVLTLTPLDVNGRFNNLLIHSVVSTPAYREQLFSELSLMVTEKDYAGIDIDFEYILKEDRDDFTEFAEALTQQMRRIGRFVSIALAPKTSKDQQGLLYEGKDYAALGQVTDHVFLMTYEWGYKYGPNMAVAPINLVRRVAEYAITEIPPKKISLGIPNYGYDWPLPYIKNETVARTIGNVEAVQIAIRNGASISFDETAMSPYFQYMSEDVLHEVWFEDVRSLSAKFDLIRELGLEGAGFWQINQLFRANWLLWEEQMGSSMTG